MIDWEVTMKCNLDCSYCITGLHGGHDNSLPHPHVDQCLAALDFMFEYADIYMQSKPRGNRYVILNVYGGESLHHPDIVGILQAAHQIYRERYKSKWHLTITTTTNAIITKNKLAKIIPLIDEFTVSYHTNNTEKQKNLFKDNVVDIAAAGKRIKCVIMMHPETELFADAKNMISWCEQNKIRFLPKQLDNNAQTNFAYQPQQIKWFGKTYKEKTHLPTKPFDLLQISSDGNTNLASVGRACCGGRTLCKDSTYKHRDFFVANQFPDWFCSVNEFFVYIKQVNGEIYTNKDCKMDFDGKVGPIGNLSDCGRLLATMREQISQRTWPTIRCKKSTCLCGLCAPKAKLKTDFDTIMEKYRA